MKKAMLFIAVAVSALSLNAQTVYVPNGTSGIGTSSNGNVGVGTSSPQSKLDIVNDNGLGLSIAATNLDPSHGYGLSFLKNTGRLLLGWNYSAGRGEQVFVANRGLGSLGGFAFYDYGNDGAMTSLLTLSGNGSVGIGTTTPIDKLQIHGAFTSTGLYEGKGIYFSTTNGTTDWGIAQITPYVVSNNGVADGYPGGLEFKTKNPGIPTSLPTTKMVIDANGSVGIGTTVPDQKLTVQGKIHAEEVIVDLNVPLADYVFGKDYDLMPLHQVDQYVQENSHLPDMPSATEVKEKGMGVGEMQNKMLQKIEELTLYVIQQDKRIKALEEENQRLKK